MDILIIAFVAAFILLRLRSELGKKTGNEPLPPAANPRDMDPLRRQQDEYSDYGAEPQPEAQVIDLEGDPQLRQAFADIRRKDPSFDVGQFLEGAKTAYGMILEAFWGGDKETLKNFLDPDVQEKFEAAIDSWAADELKIDNQLLDVNNAAVKEARLNGTVAELTVQFTSEVVAVTRDKDGKVVQGDASDAVEMNDQWTFARDTKSGDPAWTLIATSAG